MEDLGFAHGRRDLKTCYLTDYEFQTTIAAVSLDQVPILVL